eukprot:2924322-Rhodomonas_salina.1
MEAKVLEMGAKVCQKRRQKCWKTEAKVRETEAQSQDRRGAEDAFAGGRAESRAKEEQRAKGGGGCTHPRV